MQLIGIVNWGGGAKGELFSISQPMLKAPPYSDKLRYNLIRLSNIILNLSNFLYILIALLHMDMCRM